MPDSRPELDPAQDAVADVPGPAVDTGAPARSGSKADVHRAVNVALHLFATHGYAGTKLETVAKEAGMSKRMLHYHFGDKKGLYRAAMHRAAYTFSPPKDFLERSFDVPVEGVRRFVDSIFHQIVQHPDSVQLFLRENLDPVLDAGEITTVWNDDSIIMQMERLLLMGQDAGAFRPGVSSVDIGLIIASTTFFRVANQYTMDHFGAINLFSPENIDGMRRLTIDAVLAFLTSTIPDSGHSSYLTVTLPADMLPDSVPSDHPSSQPTGDYIVETSAADIYDDGTGAGTSVYEVPGEPSGE